MAAPHGDAPNIMQVAQVAYESMLVQSSPPAHPYVWYTRPSSAGASMQVHIRQLQNMCNPENTLPMVTVTMCLHRWDELARCR